MVRRHAQPPPVVGGFLVRRARALRHPGSVAGPQHRLQRGNQAARRNRPGNRAVLARMLVRLAIRNREQPASLQLALHRNAQPLGGPLRRRGIPQARLLFSRGARVVQAGRQARHLAGNRAKHLFRWRLARRRRIPGAQIGEPLGYAAKRLSQAPMDNQQRHAHDQQRLGGAGQRMPPDRRRDEGDIVEYRDRAQQPPIRPDRQRQNVHRLAARAEKLSPHPILAQGQRNRGGRSRRIRFETGRQLARHCQRPSVSVVDRYAGHLVVVLKLTDQGLQFAGGAVSKRLFRRPLLALGQFQRLAFDFGAHGMHLRGRLIQGEKHGN